VQVYRLSDVVSRYADAVSIVIEQGTPPMEVEEVIRLSRAILTDYAMLWWGSIIVNHDIFTILDQSLDREFFIVREYQLGN